MDRGTMDEDFIIRHNLTIPSCFVRMNSHMGPEKHPTVGSSGEYWSRSESLNWHFVEMKRLPSEAHEDRKVVKSIQWLI